LYAFVQFLYGFFLVGSKYLRIFAPSMKKQKTFGLATAAVAVLLTTLMSSFFIECPPDKNDTVTLIPNPNDCSSYYLCDNGVVVPMDCPPGLWFCSEKQSCNWPEDEQCTYDCVKPTVEIVCPPPGVNRGRCHLPATEPGSVWRKCKWTGVQRNYCALYPNY
jgi:hypothetical protein